jgi:hypothetical protein
LLDILVGQRIGDGQAAELIGYASPSSDKLPGRLSLGTDRDIHFGARRKRQTRNADIPLGQNRDGCFEGFHNPILALLVETGESEVLNGTVCAIDVAVGRWRWIGKPGPIWKVLPNAKVGPAAD